MRIASIIALAGFMALVCAATLVKAAPKPPFVGPALVPAQVLKVKDADTFEVRAFIWSSQAVKTNVRTAGIDTPETKGTGCRRHPLWKGKDVPQFVRSYEHDLGDAATRHVKKRIKPGDYVLLSNVKGGSFGGRVIAGVLYSTTLASLQACASPPFEMQACKSLGDELVSMGHAVRYDGGKKAAWWCEGPKLEATPKAKPEGEGD